MFDELNIICPICNTDHGKHTFFYEDLGLDVTLDLETVYSREFVPIIFYCAFCDYCFDIEDIRKNSAFKADISEILKSEPYQNILKDESYSKTIKQLFCIALIHINQHNHYHAGEYYIYTAKQFNHEGDTKSANEAMNNALDCLFIAKVFDEEITKFWQKSHKIELTIIELLRRTDKFSSAKLFLNKLESEISPNIQNIKEVNQILELQKFLIAIKSNSNHYKSEASNKINLTCTKCTKASTRGYILRLQQFIETVVFRTYYMRIDDECKVGFVGFLDLDNFSINQSEFETVDKVNTGKYKKIIINWINIKRSTDNGIKPNSTSNSKESQKLSNVSPDSINRRSREIKYHYNYHENPWIDLFGPGEEADTAYWNTD